MKKPSNRNSGLACFAETEHLEPAILPSRNRSRNANSTFPDFRLDEDPSSSSFFFIEIYILELKGEAFGSRSSGGYSEFLIVSQSHSKQGTLLPLQFSCKATSQVQESQFQQHYLEIRENAASQEQIDTYQEVSKQFQKSAQSITQTSQCEWHKAFNEKLVVVFLATIRSTSLCYSCCTSV